VARATVSVPTTPPAPGRFSTTMVGPPLRPAWSARSRATMSAAPPGA